MTMCLGQGISKYRDYHLDTREGPNKYRGNHLGSNNSYIYIYIYILCIYLPTLLHKQDLTEGQFFKRDLTGFKYTIFLLDWLFNQD